MRDTELAGPEVFTIGYGGRNPGELIQLLVDRGIRDVVDVRLRPDRAAMGIWARARTPDKGIEAVLARAGLRYHLFLELGNVFLGQDDWSDRYRRLIELAGDLLCERLALVPRPFVLMCAERKSVECHRLHIANRLERAGCPVMHLD